LLAARSGCSENTGGPSDADPPTVSLEVLDPIIATCQDLRFTVNGADNISLLTIWWHVTGVVTKDSLIQFTTTTTSYSRQFTVTGELAAGSLLIVAEATDGSGNEAIPDSTLVLVVTN
jgi:hypothetical protein